MIDVERWTTPLDSEDWPGDPWAESLIEAASDVIAAAEARDALEAPAAPVYDLDDYRDDLYAEQAEREAWLQASQAAAIADPAWDGEAA